MIRQHLQVHGLTGIGKIVVTCVVLVFLGVFTYRLVARGFDRGPEDS